MQFREEFKMREGRDDAIEQDREHGNAFQCCRSVIYPDILNIVLSRRLLLSDNEIST